MRSRRGFTRAAGEGKAVRILTNSLVANDVAAVHGGYSRYRKPLLKGGVQLWELKPMTGRAQNSSLFGSSGASLHTKAFAVDGKSLFVGSYNLDPRSTWLNCEQGVLVENEVLARELEALFETQVAGKRSWRVTLEDGEPALERRQEGVQPRPGRLRLATIPGLGDEGAAPRRAALEAGDQVQLRAPVVVLVAAREVVLGRPRDRA